MKVSHAHHVVILLPIKIVLIKVNFLFDTVSRPAVGPTQLPIQWVPGGGSFPGGKAAGA
jgi:hypothetical protein